MQGLTIEANVVDLIKTLKTNRAKHLKDHERAKVGWKKLLKKELEAKLIVLEKGGRLDLHIKNQKPYSYVDSYDEAIEMLEYASNATITLDATQYRQFVKDDWNWKQGFITTNSVYAAAAR